MSLILVIRNTSTQLPDVSDYEYEVLVGDGTAARSHTLARGEIKGHLRADGWQSLVMRLLSQESIENQPT